MFCFFLRFPADDVRKWPEFLVAMFPSGCHYFGILDGDDQIIGVMYFGTHRKSEISLVQGLGAPPDFGRISFGTSMIYVEITFSNSSTSCHTVGFLWAPDILSVDHALLSESKAQAVLSFLTTTMLYYRVRRMGGSLLNDVHGLDFGAAREIFDAHWEKCNSTYGVIVCYFSSSRCYQQTVLNMNMSGVAHAVLGAVGGGKFIDNYSVFKQACIPAVYKVRPLCYEVLYHSFDFWGQFSSASRDKIQMDLPTACEPHCTVTSNNILSELPNSTFTSTESPTEDDESSSSCVVCMEREPTLVFDHCGHLAVCGHCHKWLLTKKLELNKDKKHKQLKTAVVKLTHKLKKIPLLCPVCRISSVLVYRGSFTGHMFIV